MWSPKNPSNPTPPLISIDWSLIKEKVHPDHDHDRLTTVESGSIFLVKFFACTIPLTCFFWGKENCCLFLLLSDLNSVQFSAFFKFYVFFSWFQQGTCWSKKVLDGYNPFCANNRDPGATGNDECHGVRDIKDDVSAAVGIKINTSLALLLPLVSFLSVL